MKKFEEFMKDEFEFIYNDCENMEVLLDGFDISDDMKEKLEEDMFEKIMPMVIKDMTDSDYFWQTFHEEMDFFLKEAIKEYMISLE